MIISSRNGILGTPGYKVYRFDNHCPYLNYYGFTNALTDFDAVWNESTLLIENTKIFNVLVWIFILFT